MLKRIFLAAVLAASGAVHAAPPQGPESDYENTADTLLVGIPVIALGLTFLMPGDTDAASGWRSGFNVLHMTGEPRHDLGLAMLRTTTLTYGLKYAVDEERPNGEGGSFPSGHTAVTFAGAEFIRKEYGWAWGLPAYLAAGFVGWSRVETQDHWWHDVAAGAAIGVMSNHDFGSFGTRWGSLKLGPALLEQGDGYDPAAPGFSVEFRF